MVVCVNILSCTWRPGPNVVSAVLLSPGEEQQKSHGGKSPPPYSPHDNGGGSLSGGDNHVARRYEGQVDFWHSAKGFGFLVPAAARTAATPTPTPTPPTTTPPTTIAESASGTLQQLPSGVQRVFVHARELVAHAKTYKRLSPGQLVSFALVAQQPQQEPQQEPQYPNENAGGASQQQQQQQRYEARDVRGVDGLCVDEQEYQRDLAAAAAVQVLLLLLRGACMQFPSPMPIGMLFALTDDVATTGTRW